MPWEHAPVLSFIATAVIVGAITVWLLERWTKRKEE